MPVFVEVLTDKLEIMLKREKELQAKIAKEQKEKKAAAAAGAVDDAAAAPAEEGAAAAGTTSSAKTGPSWLLLIAVFVAGMVAVVTFYACTGRSGATLGAFPASGGGRGGAARTGTGRAAGTGLLQAQPAA